MFTLAGSATCLCAFIYRNMTRLTNKHYQILGDILKDKNLFLLKLYIAQKFRTVVHLAH